MENKKSVFETLNGINVNDHTEKKNNLTYLTWAWAWAEVKKNYPDANYTIYENQLPNGFVVNYFTDGQTCWVKTGVTINGLEHIEELPVMDYRNASIRYDKVTSFDINKAIQRSLTKAVARHGLGLYIYAGEDLPESEEEAIKRKEAEEEAKRVEEFLKTAVTEIESVDNRDDFVKVMRKYEKYLGHPTLAAACQKKAVKYPNPKLKK